MTRLSHYAIFSTIGLFVWFGNAHAALYSIVGTKDFVNGLPASLTVAERAKLVEVKTQATTEAACVQPCTLLSKTDAKAKIKAIITAENAPKIPVCTPPSILNAAKDNCITPAPIPVSGLVTYPASSFMASVDTTTMPLPNVGYSDLRIRSANGEQPRLDTGAFRVWCTLANVGFFDPIVYPNQANKGHLHLFFGNVGINPNSTNEALRTTGNSTCNGGIMNRSSYWIPAIIDTATNKVIAPRNMLTYYKDATAVPMPRGLRIIAGNTMTNSVIPATMHTWFECNEAYASRQFDLVNCNKGGMVTMRVNFPECWNGADLDSTDHRSHMAYRTAGKCPATHPVQVPTLSLITYFPVTSDGTATWRLSSDMYAKDGYNAGRSAHADFMMGWDEELHNTLVQKCVNTNMDCAAHLMGDGRAYY
jgi:Domain of unknown function (DUF1996)